MTPKFFREQLQANPPQKHLAATGCSAGNTWIVPHESVASGRLVLAPGHRDKMEGQNEILRQRGPHEAERWGEGCIRYTDNGQEVWALAPNPPLPQ